VKRWQPYVFAAGGVDRHFYEICALAELRDRLRAGDIWVTGSRQYGDFETYLIPAATFKVVQQEPLPLDIDTDLPTYLADSRQRLEENLTKIARKAREKKNAARCVARERGSAHCPAAQEHARIRGGVR
jgi:hypothetical protein